MFMNFNFWQLKKLPDILNTDSAKSYYLWL
jgi:hypothetical protein